MLKFVIIDNLMPQGAVWIAIFSIHQLGYVTKQLSFTNKGTIDYSWQQ